MYVNEKYDFPYIFFCGDLNSRTADRTTIAITMYPVKTRTVNLKAGVGSPRTKQ